MRQDEEITQILLNFNSADSSSQEKLSAAILEELYKLADRHMKNESPSHTLQATALVNEAYLRLINTDVNWKNRAHFFAVAAKQMRRILIDHARKKLAAKRGGEFQRITFDESLVINQQNNSQLVEIDQTLERLQEFDARAARFFELRLFGGLSNKEIAEVESVSLSSVERELRVAKAWLLNELKGKE